MNRVRAREQDKLWFRGDRFFLTDNQWFFTTREQIDVGPFTSREEAEHSLKIFIECLTKQNSDVEYAISVAKRGDWAVNQFH